MVSYIAITLGVFMTGVGGLMLLWGLSWQANFGQPQEIDSDGLTGGAALIPVGVLMLAFGLLWIWHGIHGFGRSADDKSMRRCPNCNRKVESDLGFCYYCNTEFRADDDDGSRDHPGRKDTERERGKAIKRSRSLGEK